MTDKDKLKALLTVFGVGFTENGDGDITCEHGDDKVGGYVCFYVDFEFDKNGKFVTMGAWE